MKMSGMSGMSGCSGMSRAGQNSNFSVSKLNSHENNHTQTQDRSQENTSTGKPVNPPGVGSLLDVKA
jgi:hypothetical protein